MNLDERNAAEAGERWAQTGSTEDLRRLAAAQQELANEAYAAADGAVLQSLVFEFATGAIPVPPPPRPEPSAGVVQRFWESALGVPRPSASAVRAFLAGVVDHAARQPAAPAASPLDVAAAAATHRAAVERVLESRCTREHGRGLGLEDVVAALVVRGDITAGDLLDVGRQLAARDVAAAEDRRTGEDLALRWAASNGASAFEALRAVCADVQPHPSLPCDPGLDLALVAHAVLRRAADPQRFWLSLGERRWPVPRAVAFGFISRVQQMRLDPTTAEPMPVEPSSSSSAVGGVA